MRKIVGRLMIVASLVTCLGWALPFNVILNYAVPAIAVVFMIGGVHLISTRGRARPSQGANMHVVQYQFGEPPRISARPVRRIRANFGDELAELHANIDEIHRNAHPDGFFGPLH